jgi:hypothetical protein
MPFSEKNVKILTALLQFNNMTLTPVEYHAHIATIAGT